MTGYSMKRDLESATRQVFDLLDERARLRAKLAQMPTREQIEALRIPEGPNFTPRDAYHNHGVDAVLALLNEADRG